MSGFFFGYGRAPAMVAAEMSELSDRVAIVTGGASGIGAATAKLLQAAGATVIVADINEAKDGAGRFVAHDVTSESSWQALFTDVLDREGRLDIMVNNAGISGSPGNVETTTVEEWQRIQAINSDGVFLGCRHAVEAMKRTGSRKPAVKGSIVNISSIAGLIGSAGPIAYTASKGAVRLLTKSVALYCAEKGYDIRCNSVHPGGVDTAIFNPLWQTVGHEQGKAFIGARHPIGRMAEPTELGEVVLFLASDRSSFVTGAEFVADGGITAGLMRRAALGAS
ncbi:NAD(P)-dependent dehydrogenase, short-chain alcohol dehydrogenase family [Enhydrobacter aerosaccus]|uniref:NAD(P)-dependent dehydrogenase, short-chain alcohol dehydrogenase family n=1 Tax=Enhydrobacter aerosaccus TaxID=225324 RepID=A0A1T4RHS6_9HYPH|nr:SDR family oxidoreductase [Enhydrobacter aerosaccus]SKA15542.1 NAD(P)-dependent dehydrogenase, short-chain alcohol dehydrogenase family [Enhydrobacter aerosaccus]